MAMPWFLEVHNKLTNALFALKISSIIRIQPQEDRVDIFTIGGGYYTVSETYDQIKASMMAQWRGDEETE